MVIIVGVMSGTSVDGIDIAVCSCSGRPEHDLKIELNHFETVPWSERHREMIFGLIEGDDPVRAGLRAVSTANFELGRAFAQAVLDVIARCDPPIASADVHAIASHGQTVFHDPPRSTLQIGDPSVIAQITGITCVADFRTADMGAGGQGAPLTSTFDTMMLRQGPETCCQGGGTEADWAAGDKGWRAVQNIGGIANATLLPPSSAGGEEHLPIAYDSGPGNCLIDLAAVAAFNEENDGGRGRDQPKPRPNYGSGTGSGDAEGESPKNFTYDVDGGLALRGTVSKILLKELLSHEYFKRPLPKTTGRELFSAAMFQDVQRRARSELGLSACDLVATLTELTAVSIVDAYALCPSPGRVTDIIVGGGGARNPVLMARIRALLTEQALRQQSESENGGSAQPARLRTHEDVGINSDAKEAMAFALLGYLALNGVPSSIPSCTGAKRAAVLGKICPAGLRS